jgi:hypothetical protein
VADFAKMVGADLRLGFAVALWVGTPSLLCVSAIPAGAHFKGITAQ